MKIIKKVLSVKADTVLKYNLKACFASQLVIRLSCDLRYLGGYFEILSHRQGNYPIWKNLNIISNRNHVRKQFGEMNQIVI